MNTGIMMELKKMMGKVIKLTTTEDKKGAVSYTHLTLPTKA